VHLCLAKASAWAGEGKQFCWFPPMVQSIQLLRALYIVRSLQSRRDRQAFTTALVPPPSPMNDRRLAVMVLLLCAVALRLPSELGPGLFVLRTISGSRSLWSSRESTRRMPPGDFLCAAPSPFLLLRFEIGKVELANGKVELANGGRRRTRRWITVLSVSPNERGAEDARIRANEGGIRRRDGALRMPTI